MDIYIADPLTGEEKASVGEIITYDSNGEMSIGSIDIETVKADNEYILTIIVDKKFLKNKETAYPVYVDPTITINSFGDWYKYINDAPLYTGYPYTNAGTSTYNCVGYVNSNSKVARTLMKFPGLYNHPIYKYGTISSVSLHMMCYSGTYYRYSNAYVYTGANWTESTAKASINNMYSINTTYNGHSTGYVTYVGEYNEINITNIVNAWKNGSAMATKGLILKGSKETNACIRYYSTESSYKPYLSVTYTMNETNGITSGGIYCIKNLYSSKQMDLNSSNEVIQKTPDSNSGKQLFEINYIGNGLYTIKSMYNNKYLYQFPEPSDNFPVRTTNSVSNDNGRWYINKTSDGYYSIRSADSNLAQYYSLGNGETTSDIYIRANTDITSSSNKWELTQVENVLSVEVAEIVLIPIPVSGATVTLYRSGSQNPYATATTGPLGKAYFYNIPTSYRIGANASKAGYATGYSSSSVYVNSNTNLQVAIKNKNHFPNFVKPYSSYTPPNDHGQHHGWRVYGSLQIHKGIDISSYVAYSSLNNTKAVGSVCNGKVVSKYNTSSRTGAGTYVIVGYNERYPGSNIYDYYVKYYHLQNTTLAPYGNIAEKGYIGLTGSTGSSSGPHLHIEISEDMTSTTTNVIDPNGFF